MARTRTQVDHIREVLPGITVINSGSHDGIYLSPERLAEMPPAWRRSEYGRRDWELVVIRFPAAFPGNEEWAHSFMSQYYPDLYAAGMAELGR